MITWSPVLPTNCEGVTLEVANSVPMSSSQLWEIYFSHTGWMPLSLERRVLTQLGAGPQKIRLTVTSVDGHKSITECTIQVSQVSW